MQRAETYEGRIRQEVHGIKAKIIRLQKALEIKQQTLKKLESEKKGFTYGNAKC